MTSLAISLLDNARRLLLLGGGVFVCGWLATGPVLAIETGPVMDFVPPAAGSYRLERIMPAPGGTVLDSRGRSRPLSAYITGRVTLLSLMYASCSNPAGCPYALLALRQIKTQLDRDPVLRARVRLVSLSFDPARDTPAVIAALEREHEGARGSLPWSFLTTASARELLPILKGYGQDVYADIDPATGKARGTYSHVLRVYLIDASRQVREIYTTSYLLPEVVANDIKTLVLEERQAGTAPLGLPAIPVPRDNPITPARIELGRKLFVDRRLSHQQTMSCAMCHVPEQGYTSNELQTALGTEGRSLRRNAPALFNVAYMTTLFHDGREAALEDQVWGPLLAANEMANPSIGYVVATLKRLPDYAGLFEAAFDGRGPAVDTIGKALAAYQRTLVSANSAFDRWYYRGERDALNPNAIAGFKLFGGKAHCVSCHRIGERHALFTDMEFHNTGIGWEQSNAPLPATQRVQLVPGLYADVDRAVIETISEPRMNDLGRYEITLKPDDRWRYRTPSLRNVALTAPYMHDGSIGTLEEVIEFYDRGGIDNPGKDTRLRPLGLSRREKSDLEALLLSLTGDNVAALIADTRLAPASLPDSP